MAFESRTVDNMPANMLNEDDGTNPANTHGKVLFRCRLCWQIALAVTVCIVAIEAVILIPSYVSYEKDLLHRLEAVGLATVRAGLSRSETLLDARKNAESLLEQSEFLGLAILGADGGEAVYVGQNPDLTIAQARELDTLPKRGPDGNRYSVVYGQSQTGLPFAVVAVLDASWIADALSLLEQSEFLGLERFWAPTAVRLFTLVKTPT